MDTTQRYSLIAAGRIGVDGYQRDLDMSWVRKIADNWDDRVFTLPKVSLHPELTGIAPDYRAIDGNHTVAGFRLRCTRAGLDPETEMLPVDVVATDATPRQEAELFLACNRGRLAVVAFDQWRAACIAQEPWALAVLRVTDHLGLIVCRRVTNGQPQIAGVSSMKTIVVKGGADLLRDTLTIIMTAWPVTMSKRFDPFMVEGLALLIRDLHLAGKWTEAMEKRVARGILRNNPATVANEAMDESGARVGKGMQNPYVWALGWSHICFGGEAPVKVSRLWTEKK